ncbi:MAG: hypothetical protein ACLRWQ_14685 [Flavonifractor plautii]
MDDDPFLTINILDVRENQVPELKKFSKSVFDIDSIFSTASELKYVHEFKRVFTEQLDTPADDFIRFFLQGCYSGPKTQNVIEKFRPVLRKALNDLISEMMNDKIKAAWAAPVEVFPLSSKPVDDIPSHRNSVDEKRIPNIVTTEEELEAFFIIKNLFADLVDIHEITYKDTESYINILYKGNIRKWICRLRLTDNQKTLIVPGPKNKT